MRDDLPQSYEEAIQRVCRDLDMTVTKWWARDLPEFIEDAKERGEDWLAYRIADREGQVRNFRKARLLEARRLLTEAFNVSLH